ncbi:MAG: hypothetical protein RIC14_03415 [Filomicrobium sp.]
MLRYLPLCLLILVAKVDVAHAQSKEIYDTYNMYRTVPATSNAQLGAINEGFFEADGLTLRLKQRICSPPKSTVLSDDAMAKCAPQVGINADAVSDTKFGLIGALSKLLGANIEARKLKLSKINISNVCIHELSLEEAMAALDRPGCLRAIQAARRDYSKVPLSQRLAEPGKWLLMFQTTRLMQADITYTLKVRKGIAIDAGIKDLALKMVGGLTNVDASIKHASGQDMTVQAKRAFFALSPRYYEELYLPEQEAVVVRKHIEKLARTSLDDRKTRSRSSPDPVVRAVEQAGADTDAVLAKKIGDQKETQVDEGVSNRSTPGATELKSSGCTERLASMKALYKVLDCKNNKDDADCKELTAAIKGLEDQCGNPIQ